MSDVTTRIDGLMVTADDLFIIDIELTFDLSDPYTVCLIIHLEGETNRWAISIELFEQALGTPNVSFGVCDVSIELNKSFWQREPGKISIDLHPAGDEEKRRVSIFLPAEEVIEFVGHARRISKDHAVEGALAVLIQTVELFLENSDPL